LAGDGKGGERVEGDDDEDDDDDHEVDHDYDDVDKYNRHQCDVVDDDHDSDDDDMVRGCWVEMSLGS
jgi:hypothetical protein